MCGNLPKKFSVHFFFFSLRCTLSSCVVHLLDFFLCPSLILPQHIWFAARPYPLLPIFLLCCLPWSIPLFFCLDDYFFSLVFPFFFFMLSSCFLNLFVLLLLLVISFLLSLPPCVLASCSPLSWQIGSDPIVIDAKSTNPKAPKSYKITEGSNFRLALVFWVQHDIVMGLKCVLRIKRMLVTNTER